MSKLRTGDRVRTKFGAGRISDAYWAHRDRYTVQYDDGSKSDHGIESITVVSESEPAAPANGRSECIITNCKRNTAVDEALCSPHRTKEADLLKEARAYVADALQAHEHSDGRGLLIRIDEALATTPASGGAQEPADDAREALDPYRYAVTLAQSLREKHFPDVVEWKPLPDLYGVLTQIDNMTTALKRSPAESSEGDLSEAVRVIMACCETLEDEASDELVSKELTEHAVGYLRGQKSTAKSLRRHLHGLTREALTATPPAESGGAQATAVGEASEFDRGVLIAVSTLINCWGRGTETEHLLAMINADEAMVESMGFEDYDREPLLEAVRATSPHGGGR